MVRMHTIILLSFWLIGALFFSILYSGEITALFSVKIPNKQINTIEELADSGLKTYIFKNLISYHKFKTNKYLNKIYNKALNIDSVMTTYNISDRKQWIVEVSEGKSAMIFFKVPIKFTVIKHSIYLKTNTKFRFMNERPGIPFMRTIAMSRRLDKQFRDKLNYRYHN